VSLTFDLHSAAVSDSHLQCCSFQGHNTVWPSKDGLWATCPRSASSGYTQNFRKDTALSEQGRDAALARHAMCESAFTVLRVSPYACRHISNLIAENAEHMAETSHFNQQHKEQIDFKYYYTKPTSAISPFVSV